MCWRYEKIRYGLCAHEANLTVAAAPIKQACPEIHAIREEEPDAQCDAVQLLPGSTYPFEDMCESCHAAWAGATNTAWYTEISTSMRQAQLPWDRVEELSEERNQSFRELVADRRFDLETGVCGHPAGPDHGAFQARHDELVGRLRALEDAAYARQPPQRPVVVTYGSRVQGAGERGPASARSIPWEYEHEREPRERDPNPSYWRQFGSRGGERGEETPGEGSSGGRQRRRRHH